MRANAISRWGGILLVGCAVLLSTRVSQQPGDLIFMLPAYGLLWAALFVALRSRQHGLVPCRWVVAACWVWLLALAANPFVSVWPQMSLWVAMIIALIPAFVLGLHRLLADDHVWNRLEWFLFVAAAWVAGAMCYEYFALGLRADGPFDDANVASAVLYASLLPLLYRLLAGRDGRSVQLLLAAFAILIATGFFAAFSRAGLIALVAALVGTALVVLAAKQRAVSWRFGFCILLVAVGFALVHYASDKTIDRNWDDLSQDSSLDARFLMWQSTLDIYADAPVLGHGLGTYKLLYPRYRSPQETGSTGDVAHNDYVQMLAEGGPLLLALLVGFVLVVLWTSVWLLWRIYKAHAGPDKAGLLRDMGLCAAILALAVHATVNFIFYDLILALLVGLYAARLVGRYASREVGKPDGSAVQLAKRGARPVIVAAALVSLVTVATGIVSNHALEIGAQGGKDFALHSNGDYRLALALSHIDPIDYQALFYLARSETLTALKLGPSKAGTTMAVSALEDTQRLLDVIRPYCAAQSNKAFLLEAFKGKADVLRRAQVWQDPVAVLQRTVAAVPTCMSAWLKLAQHWIAAGDKQRALAVLNRAMQWTDIPIVNVLDRSKLLAMREKLTQEAGSVGVVP